jgi:hypothetical protein
MLKMLLTKGKKIYSMRQELEMNSQSKENNKLVVEGGIAVVAVRRGTAAPFLCRI